MSDSAAPSEDQCSSNAVPRGSVVPYRKPAAVEYDGEARRMVAQLSQVALEAAAIAREAETNELREKAALLIDKVGDRMDVLSEHIGVLEVHADLILECMDEGENAYFINDSKVAPLTVTSMIKKRCRTIRLQKVVVGRTGQALPLVQDNENQRLHDCDGALACRIDDRLANKALTAR